MPESRLQPYNPALLNYHLLAEKMSSELFSLLFPTTPRQLPYHRLIRSILRTAHIFAAGILLGGHVFSQPHEILQPWVAAAVLTGIAMLVTDLHASFAFLFEIRGIAVIAKIILTAMVAIFPQQALLLLTIVLIIGSVSSHMPGKYRHRLLWLKKQIKADTRHG